MNQSKRNVNMSSSFSLYGLKSAASISPDWAKMADLKNINAGDAANKFYDKNLIRALDKFTAQEVHLKHLQDVKNEIHKIKFGDSPSGGLLKNGSMTGIRFNVDERNEIRKMIMLKNHLNNRNFKLQEQMMDVYTKNIRL